jgi:hypothetical protein
MRVKQTIRAAMMMGLAAAAVGTVSFAKDKSADQAPVAWGMQSGNDGCVIFRETEEMTTVSENGAYKSYNIKQLEVVDTIKATLPKKKYSETKEELDVLDQTAMQDHLKFVKIPKKYTPDQLEKAKALCGVQPAAGSQ